MSSQIWVKKQSLFCEHVRQTVYLMEERIYPGDEIPDPGALFRVRSQKCSSGIECNLYGFRCRWSGLNPVHDPFFDLERTPRR